MRSLEILEAGIQTTVQDYPGRRGMQAQGFFPAGPMDHLAHRAANLLVGNPVSAATLEITLGNFRARLDSEATIAVCGAEAPVTVDGTDVAVWESHQVPAGAELAIGIAPRRGLPLLPRGRRRLRRPAAVRLTRDVHDGRPRRAGGPGHCSRATGCRSASPAPTVAGGLRRVYGPSTPGSGRFGSCAGRRRRPTS